MTTISLAFGPGLSTTDRFVWSEDGDGVDWELPAETDGLGDTIPTLVWDWLGDELENVIASGTVLID